MSKTPPQRILTSYSLFNLFCKYHIFRLIFTGKAIRTDSPARIAASPVFLPTNVNKISGFRKSDPDSLPIKTIPPRTALFKKSRTPKPFHRKDRLERRAIDRYHGPQTEHRPKIRSVAPTPTVRKPFPLFLSKTVRRIPAIMPNTLKAADYRPDRFIFSLRSANSRIKSAVPSIPSTEESMQRW